jgi:nitroreductase
MVAKIQRGLANCPSWILFFPSMAAISSETLLNALNWRYAVKRFDATRRIPDETWLALEDALVLTPSSVGLQPWRFIVVTDPAMKAKLQPAAWNQSQVADCSHFVVMTVRRDLGDDHVDQHIARMGEVRNIPTESLGKFRSMVTGNLNKAREENRLDIWQSHQIYIALGNFMTAAALLGVDTCPMEGFEPAKFDEMLELTGTLYGSVVCCAAGYRSPDDKYATTPKVRFPKAALFRHI